MLSGILKSEVAVQVSIKIMDAFVEMRKFININKSLFEKVITIENKMDKKFIEHDKKFDIIFDQLQLEENIKQRIFFDGQIYDAYSLIIDIIKKANKKILIIDNYIDDSVLKMLTLVFLQFERINIHFNYNLKYLMIFLHNWSDKLLCFLSFCCNFAAELEQSVTLI